MNLLKLHPRLILTTVAFCSVVAAGVRAEEGRPVVQHASAVAGPAQGLDAFHLSRAAGFWASGDPVRVIEELREIDVARDAGYAESDRAAFLLGEALLQVGDEPGFLELAARAADAAGSPFRQWIAWRALALGQAGTSTSQLDGAGLLGAALLLEHGDARAAASTLESLDVQDDFEALRLHLLALARSQDGTDARKVREDLAGREARNELDAALIGGALLALALDDLETGADATSHLSEIPAESLYYERARHMLARLALDAGRADEARLYLEQALSAGGSGLLHRQTLLLRGSLDMEVGDFDAAARTFGTAEFDFERQWALLDSLQAGRGLEAAWQAWESPSSLDFHPEDPDELAKALLPRALDLRDDDGIPIEDARLTRGGRDDPRFEEFQPDREERAELAVLRARRNSHEAELVSVEHRIADLGEGNARRLRYLETGRSETAASLDEMDRALRALEARLAELELTLAAMDSVQAEATRQIVDRTRRLVTELERDRLFLQALQHFHVDGPARSDSVEATALITDEAALARELAELARFFGDTMPLLVDRSFDENLEPRLAGGTRHLYAQLSLERDRAALLMAGLDSLSGTTSIDPALIAHLDSLRAESARLARGEAELREDIAFRVAERGRARLAEEREALDYHLADAAYEQAIQLTLDPETNEDPTLLRPARAEATGRLATFLQRHPESPARAESRFRLADLHLLQARDDFQVRMADFLGENPDGDALNDRALAPFIDTEPAVALYREILDADPDFLHLDAVLFSLGMILSDDGQGEGSVRLTELVERYPDSPHAQEAWLRLGDERFEVKDFAAAIPRLEAAASGPDPSFSAIALYKLGWSHFEQDRFNDAADGFRRLMDLYVDHADLARSTDLRDEAEEYLVHSLARGGGASEFAAYFDRLGGRDYESRILANMGALLKSYALYEESIACDELWLERYPNDPAALDLAGRLVDSFGRDGRSEEGREMRLELAARFMEGSTWTQANEDPALRAEGIAFAQASYRESALHWHHEARESQAPADWSRALTLYETYLQNWDADPESARLHYQAGEAARELAHFDRALDHFAVAARDTASFAEDAAWQRVATADLWYSSAGEADSLAGTVIACGDSYLEQYPQTERAADLRWRQAEVAYRHGQDAEAARRFAAMSDHHAEDPRVPLGLRLRGDALHRSADLRGAALAYEQARSAAALAGQDSLASSLDPVIPLSWYEYAESVAAADSTSGEFTAAPAFVELARRFPDFEHADQALYRGGLGYLAGGQVDPALEAFEEVLEQHPDSEHARDASVRIAQALEDHDRKAEAAVAWAAFSRSFPTDPDAASALLRSADLSDAGGDLARGEELRGEFLDRFPGETGAVLEIREARARKALARVGSGVSLAALLGGSSGSGSDLSAYLELAAANPELASAPILAEVSYLRAAEAHEEYDAIVLTQPLDTSIKRKQAALEKLLAAYAECTALGVRVWTRASAYRIGESLIDFGTALVDSERPAGLNEDELLAYDEVLEEQGWAFFDRGEQAWTELLQQNPVGSDDPDGWLARTRESLWPRVARRFMHQPTVEYPLLAAQPPATASE